MEDKRTFEKKIDGEWTKCEMSELSLGDVFRAFESDGKAVEYKEFTEFVATSYPYTENGVVKIQMDVYYYD
jgi:hypothetical protein